MDSMMKYISRISRCATTYRGSRLAEDGLGGNQYVYILRVCRQPGISQEQLARDICVNKSSVTRQLASLEKNGFVMRLPDERDRRVMRVYPTERAEAVLPKVRTVLADWNRRLTEDFSPEESARMLLLLGRMLERAEKEVARL